MILLMILLCAHTAFCSQTAEVKQKAATQSTQKQVFTHIKSVNDLSDFVGKLVVYVTDSYEFGGDRGYKFGGDLLLKYAHVRHGGPAKDIYGQHAYILEQLVSEHEQDRVIAVTVDILHHKMLYMRCATKEEEAKIEIAQGDTKRPAKFDYFLKRALYLAWEDVIASQIATQRGRYKSMAQVAGSTIK